MQHKSLFVALLVGSVALASCMKNEESQSATDARNARTQEVQSQAALNEAQAQAALISANAEATAAAAQATIAAAEAKLKEAEAKRVEAEALIAAAEAKRVEAEAARIEAEAKKLEAEAKVAEAEAALKEIEAQLKQVEVQEELERLKILQEELKQEIERTKMAVAEAEAAVEEAKARIAQANAAIAQAEADIAQAAADKQQALNQLENLKAQAEQDALNNANNLLVAEQNLANTIAAQDAQLRNDIQQAWNQYAAAVNNLNNAQANLINAKANLALQQAGVISDAEGFALQIADKQQDITILEKQVAALKTYATKTSDELEQELEPLRAALAAAYTAENEANAAYNEANGKISQTNNGYTDWGNYTHVYENMTMPYEEGANWNAIQNFVNTHNSINKVFNIGNQQNKETERWENGVQYFDAAGTTLPQTFVPLYTTDTDPVGWGFKSWFKNEEGVVYPAPKDGVFAPNTVNIHKITFNPAKVYYDNFATYFTALVDDKKETAEANKKNLADNYADIDKYIDGRIDMYTKRVEGYTEYVETAKPEVEAAKAAMDAAEEAYNAAVDARIEAARVYNAWVDAKTEAMSAEATAERNAVNNYNAAVEDLAKKTEVYNEAKEKVDKLTADVATLDEAKYQADLAVAAKTKAYNDSLAKVTPAIQTALADAEADVAAKQTALDNAKNDARTALEAWRAANILYTQTPSDENQTALNNAQTALTDANTAVTTAQTALTTAEGTYNQAKEAFDAVNNPAEEVKKELDVLVAVATRAGNALTVAQTELANAQTALITAENNKNVAEITKDNREADVIAAHNANPEDSAEYIALYAAYWEADRAENDAYNEWQTKSNEYYDLFVTKYPNFLTYFNHTDPENEAWKNDDSYYWDATLQAYKPHQDRAQIAWYKAQKDVVKAAYEANVALEDKNVTDLEKEIADVQKVLDVFKAQEADYLAYGKAVEKAWGAKNEANKVLVDKRNARVEAQAAYNAVANLLWGIIYVDETNGNQYNITGLENLIKNKETQIQNLTKDIEDLTKDMNDGTAARQAAITNLENQIAQLEEQIEVYTKLVEAYAARLEELMAQLGEEEVPAA